MVIFSILLYYVINLKKPSVLYYLNNCLINLTIILIYYIWHEVCFELSGKSTVLQMSLIIKRFSLDKHNKEGNIKT